MLINSSSDLMPFAECSLRNGDRDGKRERDGEEGQKYESVDML